MHLKFFYLEYKSRWWYGCGRFCAYRNLGLNSIKTLLETPYNVTQR